MPARRAGERGRVNAARAALAAGLSLDHLKTLTHRLDVPPRAIVIGVFGSPAFERASLRVGDVTGLQIEPPFDRATRDIRSQMPGGLPIFTRYSSFIAKKHCAAAFSR